nr:hypothetical protein [Tanacetum cinerariifolium]
MFSEFGKTCKKRITPTRLTDGERGFKQPKACYLQDVIPFFKTIKYNFEGIQKALTKELKEMKDVFKELEAEVFSVATKSELNVARFAEMHVANTSIEARCLALEAELATLRDKSHQENQGELIKHFSKLEVDHLNLQLKYQNLKDSIGNNPPTPDKDTFDFDSVFVIGKMQASLQGKYNAIRQLKKQLSKLQVTSSDTERTIKVRTTDSQLTKITDPVTNLQAQNDLLRAENDKVKQHYKELYVEPIDPRLRNNRDAHLDYLRHLKESVETIRDIVEEAKVGSQQRAKQLAYTPLIRKKQVTIAKPFDRQDSNKQVHVVAVKPQKTNVPVPPSTGVTSYPKASGSQPKSNPKTNRISPAKCANKLPVEDLPRTNKSHLRTTNHVDSCRVNSCLNASGSQPKSHVKSNRISPAKCVNKLPVEDQPRTNKSYLRISNHVDSSSRLKRTVINLNSDSIC